MGEDTDPSTYSDEELMQAFWGIDRDLFPERYHSICEQLDHRDIGYEDLPQWRRKQINLEAEVEAASFVKDSISDSVRLGYASRSVANLIIESISVLINRVIKGVFK